MTKGSAATRESTNYLPTADPIPSDLPIPASNALAFTIEALSKQLEGNLSIGGTIGGMQIARSSGHAHYLATRNHDQAL